MSQHTPGPWQQHDDAPVYGPAMAAVVWTNKGPGHGLVADCRCSGIHHDGQVANARLIAAAPDLLEACKKARACASIPDHTMNLLRAAIARATGGAT
jgi:hypothetical protein